MFHCADPMEEDGTDFYYESIDLDDAFHPQTILAYELNDAPLPVKNGAPLRLRVERQLGYKHAKYVMRIELVAELRARSPAARAATGRTRATSGSPGSDRGFCTAVRKGRIDAPPCFKCSAARAAPACSHPTRLPRVGPWLPLAPLDLPEIERAADVRRYRPDHQVAGDPARCRT